MLPCGKTFSITGSFCRKPTFTLDSCHRGVDSLHKRQTISSFHIFFVPAWTSCWIAVIVLVILDTLEVMWHHYKYSFYAPVPLAGDATAPARHTKKYQIPSRYPTYAPGSSLTLWVRHIYVVELPRCARHTPQELRAPSNFEHVKKNRSADNGLLGAWSMCVCVCDPDLTCHVTSLGHNKQRVLMHGHQGWNVRHGLCHIYMRYVYIYELFIAFVSFVVCSLL